MSYQDHHPLYDDFQSTHYSSQQPTSQNTPPFQTRSLLQPYPLLDHVPEIQNVPHRNHMEPDGNLDGPWEVGASTQRQDVYTMPPHLNIPHFVPPPPHPEWPPFKNPPNPASPFHLYGQYRTQPTPLDAFAGDRNVPRLTFAGNLDPSTGIFYRTPEHPRLRTAQACEKCRTRKAKCSGEHPSCKRCTNRGLVCEYAKEGRVRGPNKPKIRPVTSKEELARTSTDTTSRNSPSSDTTTNDLPFSSATYHSTNRSSHRRNSISTSISLGDHRPSRPRPPNLRLESSSNLYRLEGPRSNGSSFTHAPLAPVNYRKQRQHQQLTTTTPLQSPQTMAFNQSLTLSALTAPSSYLPMYGIEAPTANANATIDESSCGSSTPSVAEIYGDVQVGREEWERGGGSDCSQSMEGVASISCQPLAASPTFDMTLVAPGHGANASGDSSSYRALVRGHLPLEKTTPPTQQHALHATGPDNVTWDTIPAPDFARQQYTGSNASHLRGLEIVPSSVRAAHGSAGSMHQPHFAAHLEYPVDPQL